MKETILEACIEISSQLNFSRRITSGSLEWVMGGRMGFPLGPNPKIYATFNSENVSQNLDGAK